MSDTSKIININITPQKILITGKNSFIGESFEAWLTQPKYIKQYKIETIDTFGDGWKDKDFSEYDIIFHVAGIAHVDISKMNSETELLYNKINRDLTIEIASKAKADGVRQFIFMSSSIIFGESSSLGKSNTIKYNSIPMPSSIYGNSKLQADEGIQKLQSDHFHVVSMRPPMIYGKNCKGNYIILSKYALSIPFFPYIKNERSMLHIENLCECIRLIIDNDESGFFYPQNKEYVNTSMLVKEIGKLHGNNIKLTRVFNPIIYLLSKRVKLLKKVFGSFTYDKEMSNYQDFAYCVNDFEESIRKTEIK